MIWCSFDISFVVLIRCPYCPAEALATTSLSAVKSNSCPKCATDKAGKHSCCARGGAWFKNCGDGGDTKFHTWTEGIQACEGFRPSVEPPPQVMLRRVGLITYPLNTNKSWNGAQQQTNINRLGRISTAGSKDCEDCVGLVKVVVCIYVFSHL